MNKRVICVGHSAMDYIYSVPKIPVEPIKVFATAYAECGGGMAANASVALARLGVEAHYWGRIVDDDVGSRILGQLIDEGVQVDSVRRMTGCASPTAAILVDAAGERLICGYNDRAFEVDTSWLPLATIPMFDGVLADVRWPEASASVLRTARAVGIPTVLDGDIGDASALTQLCALADYTVFSQPGLALASRTSEPGQGLRQMQKLAGGVVGVTLGRDGMLWIADGQERHARPRAIAAVDTLAAGDVFHAAFTLAIIESENVETAARFANAAAALKCTRFGGRRGAPTRVEVDAFLSEP